MNQYQFNNNNEDSSDTTEISNMQSFNDATRDIVSIIVRLCGIVLLFIGLWIAIQVFNEALALYKDPSNIERVAAAIEAGSNIDKSIAPLKETLLNEEEQDPGLTAEPQQPQVQPANNGVRVSYFIAWVIDLLLLLLLARIAMMAVKTGGELALYDTQVKKLARQIVQANKKES